MRCLLCSREDLQVDAVTCPGCGANLAAWLRDVLPGGTLLRGRTYRIEYALGKGGFGITYKATHVALSQPVAIKEFFPAQMAVRLDDAGGVNVPLNQQPMYSRLLQRFQREGQTLAKIEHPNVVRVRDWFEERDTAYLVMDLLSGPSLRTELDATSGGGLGESRVRQIVTQIVSGLATVHASGVYHLDIKPANVVMAPTESGVRAVLIDFGAARHNGPTNTIAYTEAYAPPELLSGQAVGPESDIFELAMLAHELLTGRPPPPAVARLANDTWAPSNDIPWHWPQLLRSALELQRGRRPSSVLTWWPTSGGSNSTPPTIRSIAASTVPVPPAPVVKDSVKPPRRPALRLWITALVVSAGLVSAVAWGVASRPSAQTGPSAAPASLALALAPRPTDVVGAVARSLSPTALAPRATVTPSPVPTPTADEAWREAQDALDATWGKWPETISLLDNFLRTHVAYPAALDKKYAAHHLYGSQLADAGKVDQAVQQFEAARDLFPERGEAVDALIKLTPTPTATPTLPPPVPVRVAPTQAPLPVRAPQPAQEPTPLPDKPPFVPPIPPTKPPFVPSGR